MRMPPRPKVDREWQKKILQELDSGEKPSLKIFTSNAPAKWYIGVLAGRDIPIKVINLGAGVKKVILEEKVCSHCGGKGFIK